MAAGIGIDAGSTTTKLVVVDKGGEMLWHTLEETEPRMSEQAARLIAMAREVTGHAIPATVEAPRPGDPAVLVADASKAKRELGWEPARALKEIVQDAWAWQRANPEGYRE